MVAQNGKDLLFNNGSAILSLVLREEQKGFNDERIRKNIRKC